VSPHLKIGTLVQAYGSGWIGSGQIPAREVAAGRLDVFGSEDPSEGGLTERQMLTTFLKYADGRQELEATAFVTRYKLALFNDFTFFLQDPVNGDEIEQDDSRTFAGARVDYHYNWVWNDISFRTSVGGEVRYDGIHVDRWDATSQNGDFRQRLGRRVDTSSVGFGGSNDDIDQENVAGYVNEDVVFGPHLRLLAGLRTEFFGFNVSDLNQTYSPTAANTSGARQFTVLSPKASAVVTPVPGLLDLYANYGTGFHTNMAQIALINGTTQINSDGTAFTVRAIPRIFGGELGARVHLFERVDIAAAAWMSYLQNETVFDADNAVFVPSAPTRRLGVDLEARAKLLPWLYADLDLAQANATAVANGGNGGAVALAPKLYLTGGVTAKHPSGIRGGLRFRYLGPRPAFDEASPEYRYFTARNLPNGQPNPDYDPTRVNAQGYFLLDAYASYRWRFLEVSLSIQNLLNSTWREAQFGNRSCTRDETYNPSNRNYAGSGNLLSDGTYADRCGIAYSNTRTGVVDVHYTPGVPFNPQLTVKGYF
jgi:hypothetical protein